MKIDWNEAPEGAEIYLPNQQGTAECFVSFRDSEVYYAYSGMNQWARWAGESKETLLSRFRHSWKTWASAGLPPVGTVCEHFGTADHTNWIEVQVIGHGHVRHHDVAFFEYMTGTKGYTVSYSTHTNFRPLRTPEQIAAEERAQGAIALQKWAGSQAEAMINPRTYWEYLYDAGARAPKVKP